jgi:hypothetical protein
MWEKPDGGLKLKKTARLSLAALQRNGKAATEKATSAA